MSIFNNGTPPRKPILLFLRPSSVTKTLTGILVDQGFFVISVGIETELIQVLRSDHFLAVVTATSMIEIVRALVALPVVNFEAFCYPADQSDPMHRAKGNRFDEEAFLRRINIVALAPAADTRGRSEDAGTYSPYVPVAAIP
jgi:hypothetical protein